MAIQIVNLAVPNGDTPRSANTKINENFSNQAHAASRLVGTGMQDIAIIGLSGIGGPVAPLYNQRLGGLSYFLDAPQNSAANTPGFQMALTMPWGSENNAVQILAGVISDPRLGFRNWVDSTQKWGEYREIYHTGNATKDANGFLKGASPVVDMYDNKIGLNHDAEQQGGITFEKLDVGDYLIKGSLGFAQEGWYIETPKDANGNVLVAVVYKQLANNDISIKTYAKKFDDETGDIIANLAKPRDIPTGRFISLRLHELPKEPPVMPSEV